MEQLISREQLLDRTPLGGNIDQDKIVPHIITAQDIYVQNVLGTKLYDKILADHAADNLTGQYKYIYDKFIEPMLCHYTASDFYLFHAYEVANGGIYRHQSENSFTPDFEEIKGLHDEQRNKAVFYQNRLNDYITRYSNEFPEYLGDQGGGMYPDSSTPNNQWVL